MLLQRGGASSLRPVTIHQILSAEQAHNDAEFFIDNKEIKDVSQHAVHIWHGPGREPALAACFARPPVSHSCSCKRRAPTHL